MVLTRIAVVVMNVLKLLSVAIMCLLCNFFCGCSNDMEVKNKKLFNRVDASFVTDAKGKRNYRYAVGMGCLTEKERIDIVCQCAEAHLCALKSILHDYQPEVRYRRGPYRTSRLESSADFSLLFELRGLIIAYEGLVARIKGDAELTLEQVHGLVAMVNMHKCNFYERARQLQLK